MLVGVSDRLMIARVASECFDVVALGVFQQLAEQLGLNYVILEVTASDEVLRQRIAARENDVSDADLDVLNYQLENWQPLSANEREHAIEVNTEQAIDPPSIVSQLPLMD